MPPKDSENSYEQPVTESVSALREEAERCRRLGAGVNNAQVRASLDARAADFEARACNAEHAR